MIIGFNGEPVGEEEAAISIYDHGFLYGMGLFETFRTYCGRAFLLPEHLARLQHACHAIGIRYTPDIDEIRELISHLLECNNLSDAYLRLTVSAGESKLGLPREDYSRPNVIMYVKALPDVDPALYTKGKDLQLLRIKRNTPEGSIRLKSSHYMNNILAKRELLGYAWARDAEGLFLNDQGWVVEGIVSNIFFIRGGICHTPAIDTGLLPGITRSFILNCAQSLRIPMREGHYRWDDLLRAEEIFLTNSIQEIVPVYRLYHFSGKSYMLPGVQAGSYIQKFQQGYRAAVSVVMNNDTESRQ